MSTVTAYAASERLYDLLHEAASRLPIASALAAVAGTRLARKEPGAMVEAIQRYEWDAHAGIVPIL